MIDTWVFNAGTAGHVVVVLGILWGLGHLMLRRPVRRSK